MEKGENWIYLWSRGGNMRIRFISDGERCCICFQPAVIKRQDIRVPNDNLLYCEACFVRIHQSMIPIMPSEAQGW